MATTPRIMVQTSPPSPFGRGDNCDHPRGAGGDGRLVVDVEGLPPELGLAPPPELGRAPPPLPGELPLPDSPPVAFITRAISCKLVVPATAVASACSCR